MHHVYPCVKIYYFQTPTTASAWEAIANGFQERWQFPNCLGAIDGKHVRIVAPADSGPQFYNYKGFSSLVLMAVVDNNYGFLYVDVGAAGRCSDAGVWRACSFTKVTPTYLRVHMDA